ncbi:MAG: CopG family ribbon-helix-helix protein [Devosia sp.]
MTDTTTITVRVPVEIKQKLDRLAEATKRSRSYLAAEALEVYVRSELEIVEGILEGLADFEAGRYVTHEEVVAESEKLLAQAYRREAEPMAKAVRGKRVAAR